MLPSIEPLRLDKEIEYFDVLRSNLLGDFLSRVRGQLGCNEAMLEQTLSENGETLGVSFVGWSIDVRFNAAYISVLANIPDSSIKDFPNTPINYIPSLEECKIEELMRNSQRVLFQDPDSNLYMSSSWLYTPMSNTDPFNGVVNTLVRIQGN